MKTIALFDYLSNGHHLAYIRLFSKTFLEMGYQVIAFFPEPDEISKWVALHSSEHIQNFRAFKVQEPNRPVLPIIGQLPQPVFTFFRWIDTAAAIRKASSKIGYTPDLVFLCWLDSYLSNYLNHHIIEKIFPYAWSGLYFHPNNLQFKQHVLPILKTPLTHYAVAQSSRCSGIALLNEIEARKLQNKVNNPVFIFPDIADESSPDPDYVVAQKIRSQAGTRKIVGLFGLLSKRKGLLTLLEVAEKSVNENWFFVFAGPLNEVDLSPEDFAKIKNIVESKPSNCFFHFESIPEGAKFNALINVCDVLFAAYENFNSSSNILTKAAIFEKLVIVSEGFCIGERVKNFQLGLTIPQGNVRKCIEALNNLFNLTQIKPDFEGYRRFHSVEQLRKEFNAICHKIG
ncbi:MAG: glycosyltransferase family 1 protein [Aetokthonos hydrillicola CCALA 1050]|nr:glycosyltransferase family 4 protein [Aetokthonos hydrillicola CCALA 1050]MBW4587881.1 glycosyltransferase family 1 protein [Aetokthonos hydrillicola CCALA 1050]